MSGPKKGRGISSTRVPGGVHKSASGSPHSSDDETSVEVQPRRAITTRLPGTYAFTATRSTFLTEVATACRSSSRTNTDDSEVANNAADDSALDAMVANFDRMVLPRSKLTGDSGGKLLHLTTDGKSAEIGFPREWLAESSNVCLIGIVKFLREANIHIKIMAVPAERKKDFQIEQASDAVERFFRAFWMEICADRSTIDTASSEKTGTRVPPETLGKNAARYELLRLIAKWLPASIEKVKSRFPSAYHTSETKEGPIILEQYLRDVFTSSLKKTMLELIRTILEVHLNANDEFQKQTKNRVTLTKLAPTFSEIREISLPTKKIENPAFKSLKLTPNEPRKIKVHVEVPDIGSLIGLRTREVKFVKEVYLAGIPTPQQIQNDLKELVKNKFTFGPENQDFLDEYRKLVERYRKYVEETNRVVGDLKTILRARTNLIPRYEQLNRRKSWDKFKTLYPDTMMHACVALPNPEVPEDKRYVWNSNALFPKLIIKEVQYEPTAYLADGEIIREEFPSLYAETVAYKDDRLYLLNAAAEAGQRQQ